MHDTREPLPIPVFMVASESANGLLVMESVDPADLSLVLMAAAEQHARADCLGVDCDGCNAFRLAYWKLDATLDRATRRQYQHLLREANVPLPGAPSEEVA